MTYGVSEDLGALFSWAECLQSNQPIHIDGWWLSQGTNIQAKALAPEPTPTQHERALFGNDKNALLEKLKNRCQDKNVSGRLPKYKGGGEEGKEKEPERRAKATVGSSWALEINTKSVHLGRWEESQKTPVLKRIFSGPSRPHCHHCESPIKISGSVFRM